MCRIAIPAGPAKIMDMLAQAGHEAYAVGGCVRDALLGRTPHDWDVCTSSRPGETADCFRGLPVIGTGLKHGTLAVVLEGETYEITTYRVDGPYTDGRHPDGVTFVPSLAADLARRDFTVNAMAAGRDGAVVDLYGGRADLAAGILRCVGEPDRRFHEDALRMLRAVRFASAYGFTVAPDTADAIHRGRALLLRVAKERVSGELVKLLVGSGAGDMLREFPDLLAVFWPELSPMRGFDQHNPRHTLDVWDHTALAVERADPDVYVRLALLLHDVGKPACFTRGEDGMGHFYAHAQTGAALAEELLRRLRFDGETIRRVTELVTWHDAPVAAEERAVRRWLNRLGEGQLRRLLQVKRADALAQNPALAAPVLERLAEFQGLMDQTLAEGACFSLRGLRVGGRELLAQGIPPGPGLGALLNRLLELVIEGEVENEPQALLAEARRISAVEGTGKSAGKKPV